MRNIERFVEAIIFYSRWLLAPFYLGLAASLLLLLYQFGLKFYGYAARVHLMEGSDIILAVLNLIDLTFTANLVLIVIFSGYENFVSRMELEAHERPDWMTKVDFGGLKQKLMTSIVAISAVAVLEAFMNIDHYDSTKLAWLVGIHIVFLFSLLAVALSDRLTDGKTGAEQPVQK